MAGLRWLATQPGSGSVDRKWVRLERDDSDRFVRLSKGICELYSQGLAPFGLQHKVSTLYVSVADQLIYGPPGDGWTSFIEGTVSGWESSHAVAPEGFIGWDLPAQQEWILGAVHNLAVEMAGVRGLPTEPFVAARQHVVDQGFVFWWESDWKSSPGRVYQAKGVFRSDEDGFGRVIVHV